MVLGIIMIGTGLFTLWQVHKITKRRAHPTIIGLLFLVGGIFACIASILDNIELMVASIGLAMGCVLIWVFLVKQTKVFCCTKSFTGKYIRCNPCGGSRGFTYFTPIFKYNFDGQEYELQSG